MRHEPVLLKETIESLQLKSGAKVIDCTLGDGGHSEAVLQAIGPKGKLLGIDADPESLLRAKQYLYSFADQITFVRDNFSNLSDIVSKNNFGPADAVIADFGWSSPQFEERERGFSFEKDEPLDMRFGGASQTGLIAKEVINEYSESDLAKIFHLYGEEKLAKEIAQALVEQRKIEPLATTKQLSEVILQVYRQKLNSVKEIPWVGGIHPATKVFQAIRIEVNQELEVIKKFLPQAVEILAPQGRLAVITFHSLEDRIVKHFFQSQDNKNLKIVNKKPIIADALELEKNPRARSAKLRIIEKI